MLSGIINPELREMQMTGQLGSLEAGVGSVFALAFDVLLYGSAAYGIYTFYKNGWKFKKGGK
jgi:hypothetical protein